MDDHRPEGVVVAFRVVVEVNQDKFRDPPIKAVADALAAAGIHGLVYGENPDFHHKFYQFRVAPNTEFQVTQLESR